MLIMIRGDFKMKVCFEKCMFNTEKLTFDDLRRNINTEFHTLKAKTKNNGNYRLSYVPVGNYPNNPTVIIAGKTPGLKTRDKFNKLIRSGISMELAAFQSIYSEMKQKLFMMLNTKTRFFDYMELVAPNYWKGKDKEKQWNNLFNKYESSRDCGVQLTQICNCCIHTSDSKEPSKKAYREIESANPNCLFSSFIITDSLKLIIFLDTPRADYTYHPEEHFLKTDTARDLLSNNVAITSFPHPSGRNPATNYNIWSNPDVLQKKYPNVFKAIENTSLVIDSLINLC